MILIKDNLFTPEQVTNLRQGAIAAGFDNWVPPSHTFGSGIYKGMCWAGNHADIHNAISSAMGGIHIIPNKSFFRILTADEEKRLIHSDRNDGTFTAITYLSDHKEISGTGFYRHLATGKLEMPPISEMNTDVWGVDMKDDSKWEQLDFIRGIIGRMVIFSAPLFHARVPSFGIGSTPEDARMIHVCHFYVK